MAQATKVISNKYSFLRICYTIRNHQSDEVLALLDTGFTGHLAIPLSVLNGQFGLPDTRTDWEVADGSIVDSPVYFGRVEILGLSSPLSGIITVLGNDYVLGRGILDRFRITFDHGQKVILEL